MAWLDDSAFITANEGNYQSLDGLRGGSRGFTMFSPSGRVMYDSGASFEHDVMSVGHYDDSRSANRGSEPSSIAVARFDGDQLMFIGAEQANVVGVYRLDHGRPTLLQMLPTGDEPADIAAAPLRNVLAVSASGADEEGEYPSMITIYERGSTHVGPVQLRSIRLGNAPIPWSALSGLSGDPTNAQRMYSVNDASFAETYVYTIALDRNPAEIVDRRLVVDASGQPRRDLDAEGLAARPSGGVWMVSELRTGSDGKAWAANALLRVEPDGTVAAEVPIPTGSAGPIGVEGVAVSDSNGRELVFVAFQKPDIENLVLIARYEVDIQRWTFARYATDIGDTAVHVADLAILPDGRLGVLERDNGAGGEAVLKRVYAVDQLAADFHEIDHQDGLDVLSKSLEADIADILTARSIWAPDKPEGLGVTADGAMYVVTDNDGLDDALGQTLFLRIAEND